MDQGGERTADDVFSDSVCSFVNGNTVEDHYAMNRDLNKKIQAHKEGKEMMRAAIDETRAEIEAIQNQQEAAKSQASNAHTRIAELREKIQAAKKEKANAEKAERQRAEHAKQSGMTMEQMVELRDQLTSQRSQINDLEARLYTLEQEKTAKQKQCFDQQSAVKEQSKTLEMLKVDLESNGERREYLSETYASLRSSVEAIQEEIQRLRSQLANPKKEESDQSQSLFEEITAEKKALESELIGLIDFTNALRQQIRQKQEEIDELESHESENLCNVDTEYVVSKMRKLLAEENGVCDVMKNIEKSVTSGVAQFEQLQVKSTEGQQAELGKQYLNLRDYQFDCVKNVINECNEGINSENFKSFIELLSTSSSN